MLHSDIAVTARRTLDRTFGQSSQRFGRCAHLLQWNDATINELKNRLDRKRLPNHSLGCSDAATTSQIVQGVHVEQHAADRTSRQNGLAHLVAIGAAGGSRRSVEYSKSHSHTNNARV